MFVYNPANWYWIVGGDSAHAFASAYNAYVPTATDVPYGAWIAAGNSPTQISTEANLIAVLAQQAPSVFVPSIPGLSAYAAGARYQKEIAGITVGGVAIATDDRSKQLIDSIRMAAQTDPNFTTQFVSGTTVTPMTGPTVIAVSNAVSSYVASTFSVLATTLAGINGSTITTKAQVDSAFAAISGTFTTPVPMAISRRQFYQQLVVTGTITAPEALAAIQTGTVPPELATMVSALPAPQQFTANMFLAGNAYFYRDGPITLSAATTFGWSSATTDAFFVAASLL
jgi:hypothetical protein